MKIQARAVIALILACSLVGSATAAPLTSGELLQKGMDFYASTKCVQAAEHLFAYVQLQPPRYVTDVQHRQSINNALAWCEKNSIVGASIKSDGGIAPVSPKPPLAISPPPMATVNRRCKVYATLAVGQQSANQAASCGLSGGRWDSNYDNHYNWCVNQKANTSNAESLARTRQLNSCAQ